jgi:NADH-quinone oxidoreductase subunit F
MAHAHSYLDQHGPVGPVPQEHNVVFNTLHFDQPWTYENYLKAGGYQALRKILTEKMPDQVAIIDMVKASGLRGSRRRRLPDRPQVEFHAAHGAGQKYILCNSDESEPGTCKDRDILRYNPHAVLEGLAIACYATGSSVAYNYMRGEFHHEPFERISSRRSRMPMRRLAGQEHPRQRHRHRHPPRSAPVPTSAARKPR